jgi:hemolysin activation/secretion protein
LRWLAAALAFGLLSTAAVAQVIPPSEQAGRERERFIEPQAPRARPGGPTISLPSTTAPAEAQSIQVVIRRIRIVGATVYSEADFVPLYEGLLNGPVPLQAVYDLAQRITAKYGSDGYVLTRAVVPVQELEPGGAVVQIEVIEGYIDQVEWPARLAHYRDFFTAYALKITAERPINVRTLERYLLLANDLPGLRFKTSLKPSPTRKGAATLVVEVTEKPVDFFARVDNRGTLARGPLQFMVAPTVNNIMRQHEAFSVAYASVAPFRELQYVSVTHRQVLNSEGLTVFTNGSYSWGYPGTPELDALNFRTTSSYGESGLQFPVIRAREQNLTLSAMLFAGENYSFWNLTPTDPQAVDRLRGVRLRAEGDYADKSGAINQYVVTFSQGFLGLGGTENDNPLSSRLGGRVDFNKIEALVSRLQPLMGGFSTLIAIYGQYAFTPLLVPEQCGYGGRLFGRAFDPSELLGDHCVFVSVEGRFDVPRPPAVPQASAAALPQSNAVSFIPNVQWYGFADVGRLYRLSTSPVGTGSAQVTAASAGAGVRLGWENYFNVDLSLAKAIEGPRDVWRFFFITSMRY